MGDKIYLESIESVYGTSFWDLSVSSAKLMSPLILGFYFSPTHFLFISVNLQKV